MKLLFCLLHLTLLLLGAAADAITGDLFTNGQDGFPDPCIFQDPASGLYYVYADRGRLAVSNTNNLRGAWTVLSPYEILNPDGSVFENGSQDSGGDGAPSVGYINSKYVLYFASGQKVLVATGSSPKGPFTLTGTPLLIPAPNQPVTKNIAFPAAPALFQYQGNNYMVYKYGRSADYNHVSSICIRPITANGLSTTNASPTQMFTVTAGVAQNGMQFTEDEGPNLVAHGGSFYLFFNAGTYCAKDYRIVYATSNTLMSAYTFGDILLKTGDENLVAPGGISFVDDTNFIFMSYEPNATPSCGTTDLPPRNVHAGQIQYNGQKVSIASSFS